MSTEIVQAQPQSLSLVDAGRFDHIQRVAKMFSESQLVPTTFQKSIPNVVIALEMASRIGASPLMVMQHLSVIHGKPSFGASFLIATVNSCGRFTPLRFAFVGERNTDAWGCYAVAKAKDDGAECRGVTVTMEIAKAEGWVNKNGSKWKTMPELMMQYRAATWWVRMFAPEVVMGFPTEDEVVDIKTVQPVEANGAAEATPVARQPRGVKAIKTVEKVETVPAETPAATAQEPATADAAEEAPATASESEPVKDSAPPAPTYFSARCEITDLSEKQAKKKGGVIGPVTTVVLKGEFNGAAFFDGAQDTVPGIGSVVDVDLEQRELNNTKVHVIQKIQVAG